MTATDGRYFVSLLVLAALLALNPSKASAQRVLPGEERPELKEFLPEEEAEPSLALPPIPVPAREKRDRLSTGARFFVKEFQIVGNTVISDEELTEVIAPYTNRELTAEDLVEAREAVTKYYISHGYVSSGAVLPDQSSPVPLALIARLNHDNPAKAWGQQLASDYQLFRPNPRLANHLRHLRRLRPP